MENMIILKQKLIKIFKGTKVIGTVSTVNIGDSYSGIITEIEENEGTINFMN